MKFRHNKKRNSAFVYEALIKEATIAIIKKDTARKEAAATLIKKHFKSGSLLKKDLECYRSLYENQSLDQLTAEKIIKEVKLQKRLLDTGGLFQQQSALIHDVNAQLAPGVFNNYVPNYKTLATIAQIFSHKISPKNQVILENTIVKNMGESFPTLVTEIPVDKIVYKTFVEKFNSKYDDELLDEQKELLSCYIASFTDNALQLKTFLNEEIARLKSKLKEATKAEEIEKDEELLRKTYEAIERLDIYSQRPVSEEVLLTVMKTQALVKEIYSHGNND